MPNFTTFSRLSTLTTLSVVTLVPLLTTADVKMFPARLCRSDAGAYSATEAINNGDASNSLSIFCPILRDNTTADEWSSVEIRVKDQSNSTQTVCYPYVGSTTSFTTGTSVGSGLSFQGFATLSLAAPINSHGVSATYGVKCVLAGYSSGHQLVYGYRLVE